MSKLFSEEEIEDAEERWKVNKRRLSFRLTRQAVKTYIFILPNKYIDEKRGDIATPMNCLIPF